MKKQVTENLYVTYNETFTIRFHHPIDGEKSFTFYSEAEALKLASEILKWATK